MLNFGILVFWYFGVMVFEPENKDLEAGVMSVPL